MTDIIGKFAKITRVEMAWSKNQEALGGVG